MRKCDVGGQAVIEGVMMRGSKGIATAIRTSKGNIKVSVKKTVPLTKKYKILSLPFIRGITALLDSLIFMFSNVWRGLAFIVCFAILVDGIVDLVKAMKGIDKKEKTKDNENEF